MPKPKPTQVIRHEIVLGKVERELIQNATTTGLVVGAVKDLLPYVKTPAQAILLVEGIATFIEAFGIETGLPTGIDLWEYLQRKKGEVTGFVETVKETIAKALEPDEYPISDAQAAALTEIYSEQPPVTQPVYRGYGGP